MRPNEIIQDMTISASDESHRDDSISAVQEKVTAVNSDLITDSAASDSFPSIIDNSDIDPDFSISASYSEDSKSSFVSSIRDNSSKASPKFQ
ncbi:uncharacterized protein isoform X2 [Leptinotarsa decemlineata]|uniref:uncharacterized protein isoform X2 n=1 Tax=Leptinotarsa decemlineata TaxID=7539 RepID=UPI003D304B0A